MKKFLLRVIVLLTFFGYNQSASAQRSAHDMQQDMDRMAVRNWLYYKKKRDEGSNVKNWWKLIRSTAVMFNGDLTYTKDIRYDRTIPNLIAPPDTSYKATVKSLIGYSFYGGEDHLLVKTGEKGMVSISDGVQINILRYKLPDFKGGDNGDGLGFQIGVPVTFDYKWGCDVNFDPEGRFGLVAGAGAMPYCLFSLNGQTVTGASPYFYASFGVFAWRYWKIRVAYQPGMVHILNNYNSGNASTGIVENLTTSNLITIGIGTLQYSHDWTRARGWRTGIKGGGGRHRTGHRLNGRMF